MNIVFVGAGGIGISSLAFILKDLGYNNILCIDSSENQITKKLDYHGIKTIIGHGNYEVQKDDFVIYSDAAINSPEVKKSFEYTSIKERKHFHKPYSYFEFLGEISKLFKTISIAGTHGKSTTSAMMIDCLVNIEKKHSINTFGLGITGALVKSLNYNNYYINDNIRNDIKMIFQRILTGVYVGFDHELIKKYIFVIEADEFNKHFLHLDTDFALITNIELDHSDVFGNFENYFSTFKQFGEGVKSNIYGLLHDSNICNLQNTLGDKVKFVNTQKFSFRYLFGEHNHENASLCYETIKGTLSQIKDIEISPQEIKENIESFPGLRRRMELLKELDNGCIIYTDYGHHPSELNAVSKAIRQKFPKKKITCIFQPHQARRVLEFWDNFIQVLKGFDETLIYNIYTARENLEDLKKVFINNDFNGINDIVGLGNLFASKIGGKYTQDINQITQRISSGSENEIIVCFSAGNLDYDLRKHFKI